MVQKNLSGALNENDPFVNPVIPVNLINSSSQASLNNSNPLPPAPPPPQPPRPAVITTNPTLADGVDNVITDGRLGFNHVISYSLDGSNNNPSMPSASLAGGVEARLGSAHFQQGTTNTPVDGPNARLISDTIMSGTQTNDPAGHSAYMYAFGQFVDHDIDLNPSQTTNATNTLSTIVPANDLVMTPGSSITITRGQVDSTTGNAINAVTSVLDLSQVYGSDATTAASLRNSDGTLVTSAGDNPAISNGQFISGDIRTAENPDLTAVDALFIREHNYWVANLKSQQPSLTGDQLYDMARAITTAEYQNIVYKEYVTALIGQNALTAYKGFDPKVSTSILEEFSTAAYRFGHSIISTTETKISNSGQILEATDLLQAMSETTSQITANGGFDALLRNLAQDTSNNAGVVLPSDLLNLVFPGGSGGNFDLGAVDVMRERDLGIPTLNDMRKTLGLSAYTDFSQVTTDAALASKLKSLYGSVDNLDLFVGGLAENHASGAMVGSTFQAIIALQFENLRNGDRLYYENQGFTPQLMQQIENTTLSELILRDTDTSAIQQNAFIAADRHMSNVAPSNSNMPQLIIGIDTDNATIQGINGVVNTLVAGAGKNQLLVGAGSQDDFVFVGQGHQDRVSGFRPGIDHLIFDGLSTSPSPQNVIISPDNHNGTLVQVAGESIDLLGISPAKVSMADLIFNIS